MSNAMKYNRPVPRWALPITRLIFVCALIYITYSSVRPALASVGIPNFDKVLHAAAYFMLAGFLALAMPKLRLWLVALLPALYGGIMEIAQLSMAAGRTGSFFDMAANITGAVGAVFVWWLFVTYIWNHEP